MGDLRSTWVTSGESAMAPALAEWRFLKPLRRKFGRGSGLVPPAAECRVKSKK
jgi:hypothetical protein